MKKKLFFCALLPVFLIAHETVLHCDFNQWGHGWTVPSYYSGKVQFTKTGGRTGGMLKLTPSKDKKGKIWGRAVVFPKTGPAAGRIIRLSGYVRGKGRFSFGFTGGKGSDMILAPEWKWFEYTLNCTVDFPASIIPRLELTGEGEALIDDVKLEFVTTGKAVISTPIPKIRLKNGAPNPEITFSTGHAGNILMIYFLNGRKKLISQEKVMTNGQGKCAFIPGGHLAPGKYYAVAAAGGKTCRTEIEVLP